MNYWDGYYKRDLTPIKTKEEFNTLLNNREIRVAGTNLGPAGVSTVFLQWDHGMEDDGPPVLFETMVFGGKLDGQMERYCTEAEALLGHERMVKRVRRADTSWWYRFKAFLKVEPKCPHVWSKWEDTGEIVTRIKGLDKSMLGAALFRRYCSACGASQKKWM